MDKTQIDIRISQLEALEMYLAGDIYVGKYEYNRDFNVSIMELKVLNQYTWDKTIINMNKERSRRLSELKHCRVCGKECGFNICNDCIKNQNNKTS